MSDFDVQPIGVAPSLLGESPMWHPEQQALYWCDIPGRKLNRYHPASNLHQSWGFDTDVSCCAPLLDGDLLLAMRDGLWRFNLEHSRRHPLLKALPYDPARERFNDGKADPQGRFWVGTIYEPRDPPLAALYRYHRGTLAQMADGITTSNGLAWSPDGRTMYWSDTKAHTIYALDFDPVDGQISNRRVFARFAAKGAEPVYGGRPDGATVDAEGCYWVSMFEGARVLRLSPKGEVLQAVALPAQCPTMPCFGDADLKTLYITTGRENRPAAELAALPFSGCVLKLRVSVPGLPVNFART